MDGQHVGPFEELVAGDKADTDLLASLAGQVRAPGDDVHPEREPEAGHRGAEVPEAQDREGGAVQRPTDASLPAACSEQRVLGGHRAGGGRGSAPR